MRNESEGSKERREVESEKWADDQSFKPVDGLASRPNTNVGAMKGKIVISQLYQGVEANKKGRSRTIAGRKLRTHLFI